MDINLIISYLRDITANNNREWFHAHKAEYDRARKEFETAVEQLMAKITVFDPSIAHLTIKDVTYRFNRDTRFSPDKSPYKRHFGAYIAAKGKKSLHGGYYIHFQPGNCFIATGSYWLPTNILTACRNEIMANIDEWRKAVENGQFVKTYGYPGGEMADYTDESEMTPKGFGMAHLKKAPKDFPADYEFIDYLKMKDYCCWHRMEESDFTDDKWMTTVCKMFKIAKPMMDFTNAVIDDYE